MAQYREAMASGDKPINPYRVYAGLMEVLDPYNSFITHESGNTRDQLSTVYDTLVPRAFLGWGNVSTLGFGWAGSVAARLADPNRPAVTVTGEAGLGYMLGNLEVALRQNLGVTVAHISNGGFAGYGPGFWGPGHDPFTHSVLGPDEVDMSRVIGELGYHTERVSEPSEVEPALRRALAARDRQCRFPGCRNVRVDAHHIEHWARGGATALDNLVLLCRPRSMSCKSLFMWHLGASTQSPFPRCTPLCERESTGPAKPSLEPWIHGPGWRAVAERLPPASLKFQRPICSNL